MKKIKLKFLKNTVFINAISLVMLQGARYLIPLIVLPYVTKALTPHSYGVYTFYQNIISYMIIVINFGFDLSSSRFISNNRHDQKKINECFAKTIQAKLFLFIMCLFCLFCYYVLFLNISYYQLLIFTVLLIQLLYSTFMPLWLFQGLEKIAIVSLLNTIVNIGSIPFIFYLVNDSSDLVTYCAIVSITTIFSLLISYSYIKYYNLLQFSLLLKFSLKSIVDHIRSSSNIFLGSLSFGLSASTTIFFVGLICSKDQVTYYYIAELFRSAVLTILLVIGNAIYPRVAYEINKEKTQGFKFIKKIFFLQTILSIIIFLGFIFIIPIILLFMFGNSYHVTISIIYIISPVIISEPLYVFFGNYVLLPLNHDRLYRNIRIITILLHIAYTPLLVKLSGLQGAAYSFVLTEILSTVIILFICYRKNYLQLIFNNMNDKKIV